MTQRDLSLAYTPGVAEPCKIIQKSPEAALEYTARGNLVAVVTNGTAVSGAGQYRCAGRQTGHGGKSCPFQAFCRHRCLRSGNQLRGSRGRDTGLYAAGATFGGINLEDIKAPECFHIEQTLKRELSIPVFHDDQHGTAIISGAGLLNALKLTGRDIASTRVVVNGAGAAKIACARFYRSLGIAKENLILCDSRGVIFKGRESGMNSFKQEFAVDTPSRTL